MCACTYEYEFGNRLHKFCLQKPKLFKLNKPLILAGWQQHRPWATAQCRVSCGWERTVRCSLKTCAAAFRHRLVYILIRENTQTPAIVNIYMFDQSAVIDSKHRSKGYEEIFEVKIYK